MKYYSLLFISFVISLASGASVTFYRDSNYGGQSIVISSTNGLGACYSVPSAWTNQPTSLRTSGAQGIIAYNAANCGGDSVSFFAPVQWMGDIWNDRLVSFRFRETIGETPLPPIPANDPTYGVCKVVLIVDNYVVRSLNASLSTAQMTQKYRSYFSDIDAYYTNNFNTHLVLDYIHIETGGSFSSTTDAGTLLTDFNSAVSNKRFGSSMPTGACIYHLITGRQPSGVAGLAYVGVTCGGTPNGYSVDARGQDGAGIVLRRAIHEIGHNFNGNHPDAYTNANPPYTCSVDNNLGPYRILRGDNEVRASQYVPYIYLEAGARMSECSTQAITRSLTAYQCLYTNFPTSLPAVTFYQDINYGGGTFRMSPRRGNGACYNLMSFGDRTTAIQASSTQIGSIIAYADNDCRGESITLSLPQSYVGNSWNDRISSFKFVVA